MYIWKGTYANFMETGIRLRGFHDSRWFEKQRQSSLETLNNYKFKKIEYDNDYNLDYFLLPLLSLEKNISLCDIGGSMGQHFIRIQNKFECENLTWDIVESVETVKCVPFEIQQIKKLNFFTEIPRKKYDIVHLGSVLQYIEKIEDFISTIINLEPRFILINDLPCGEIPSFTTVQAYYDNPIPVNWYNYKFICDLFERNGFSLISKAKFRTNILNKEKLSDLSDLPIENKIDHTLNLIFKAGK